MVEKWEVTLPELTGDEPRRAYVYLPKEAEENPKKRFPVLYMFDGHNVFFDEDATYGKCWGMKEYLDYTDTPLIVAAVECNHSPEGGRLSEYSPFTFDDPTLGFITGRGHETMEWFVNVFKPYIDKHYPTLPDRNHTFIGGSSMGGLMSLYGVIAYNHVFSRAAALSPSIWFATDQLDEMLKKSPLKKETVIYMDYGSREMKFHSNMAKQFNHVSGLLLKRGVWLTTRIVPWGDHCEASWEKQIPFFLSTLLYER